MFGPLSFPSHSEKRPSFLLKYDFGSDEALSCIFCEENFNLPSQQNQLLSHLFSSHRLVIADVDVIANLKSYLDYWRVRFASYPIKNFCSTVLLDVKPDGSPSPEEEYFLLSDVLPEDKLLREGLQQKRLEWVLERQAEERDDTSFCRSCLFCRLEVTPTRKDYFNHLSSKHNLQLGLPENLVFTDKLLDTIQEKMDSLQCLFCEKYFKDRNVLKEHMRKKQHKRINPDNKLYDKFYIVNYLEMGKNWLQVQREPEEVNLVDTEPENDDSNWSDWQDEDSFGETVVCLFCETAVQDFESVLRHMITVHSFNFVENCKKNHLNFYDQVKLVNFIRRQVHQQKCVLCSEWFADKQSLFAHMKGSGHIAVPDKQLWNQPEFYFPTYENDSFLCFLEDLEDNDAEDNLCMQLEQQL
ncbi:zinc finger protein 277 [Bacillus rossius redtenbacheri]|uniref:zinc finger protein 277 n=1 Tax=Bacillus rossius redtenbacheri TaxID=93214 RepID=UPI002FDF0A4C